MRDGLCAMGTIDEPIEAAIGSRAARENPPLILDPSPITDPAWRRTIDSTAQPNNPARHLNLFN